MKIPSNKVWTQLNEGETSGILHETRNMALDTLGQAKLAKRPVALMSSATDSDFVYPMAITYFDDAYTVVTSGKVFQGVLDGNVFTESASFTPSVTLASDALVFKDTATTQLLVTIDANLARWNGGGSATYTLAALTSGVPHPMCIFDSNPTYKLAIGNGNLVHTYDTSYNLNPTILTLASQFTVTSLRYRNGYLYIGTKTSDGTEARIFIWNGTGTNAQYECPVGCEWVFALTEYGSSVAAIVSSGELIQISGSQYVQLAAFPVFYDPHAKWQGANGLLLNGKVFNRGIATVGQNIYMNIDGDVDVGFIPEMKSGLWVFDPNVGLYHRGTSTTNTLVSDTTFTFSGETITTGATHNLKDGDGIEFALVSGITGVSSSIIYYVTVVSVNQIKISISRKSQKAGRYITLGGARVSEKIIYYPNIDSGNILANSSGAIAVTTINESSLKSLESEVIWGCRTENESNTAQYVLNGFHDSNNIGHLMTQRIYTENIEDTWKQLYSYIDNIITDEDIVVAKYQNKSSSMPVLISGTWLDTQTINSTDPRAFDIAEGNEIVLVDGKGQGKTVHVTEINLSSSTVSLVVDEAIGTDSLACRFYFTNFIKIGEFGVDKNMNEYFSGVIDKMSPWIKIKLELRGGQIAVNMMELSHSVSKSSK